MWTNFFTTAAEASASLAGLVFVALSVNIARIVEEKHLPARAAATIATLILVVVSSLATLVPQSPRALGCEILVLSVAVWLGQIRSTRRGFESARPRWESAVNAVVGELQVLPFVVGSILLLGARESGLYWVAAGCLATFVFAVLNAWILLVEILR